MLLKNRKIRYLEIYNRVKSNFCIVDERGIILIQILLELINYQKTIPSEKSIFDVEKIKLKSVGPVLMVHTIILIGEKNYVNIINLD